MRKPRSLDRELKARVLPPRRAGLKFAARFARFGRSLTRHGPRRGRTLWEVIDLDVWGNRRDGFEVNDASHTGRHVTLPGDPTDEEVVQALVREGELRAGTRASRLTIDGDDRMMSLEEERTGRPVLQLFLVGRTSDGYEGEGR